jgi:hypothetical protein
METHLFNQHFNDMNGETKYIFLVIQTTWHALNPFRVKIMFTITLLVPT